MKTTVIVATTVLFASTFVVSHVQAETPSLAELAPDSTFLVVGSPKAAHAMSQLQATQMWGLWTETDEADREAFLRELHEELELEPGELSWPDGTLGFAMYTVFDAEVGATSPAYLAMADYAGKGDDVAKIIDRVLERGVNESAFTLDEQEIAGRTVRVLEFPKPPAAAGGDEAFGEMGGADPWAGASSFEDAFRRAYLVQHEGVFLLVSERAALRNALETLDGDPAKPLSARADFQGVQTRIGESDAYAIVINRNLGGLLSSLDPMGMSMMVTPMLKQVIGDVAAMGMGFRLNTTNAMLEQSAAIYMPNGTAGLSGLMKDAGPREALPSFVGPDVLNMAAINMDFRGLPQAIQPVMQMAQMFMMQEPGGGNPMAMSQTVEQICSYLGKRMYMVQWAEQPITTTSMKQLVAVECTNANAFEQFLAATAGNMGMKPRDFLGHRLYTMPAPGLGGAPMGIAMPAVEPPAMAIAGGHVFMGPTGGVEHVLRLAGQERPSRLSDEPTFARAVELIDNEPSCAWGFGNVAEMMRIQSEVSGLQMKAMMDEMRAEDPDLAEQIEVDMTGLPDLAMLDMLTRVDMKRYFGPSVWSVIPDESGFRLRAYLLAPDAD